MNPTIPWLFVFSGMAAVAACSSNGGTPAGPPAPTNASLTYYKDVKPILDAKCATCHVTGGLAPFPLLSYADAIAQKGPIVSATSQRIMPPWPPDDSCTGYAYDRSLSAEQIQTVGSWVSEGAAEGDPSEYVALSNVATQTLSRVDVRLKLPAPYVPALRPDDYHCFLLDWPEASDSFVTGIGVKPGQSTIVHHVLFYAIPPAAVTTYQGYETAPGAGYTCFGGPQPSSVGSKPTTTVPPSLIGGWVPGVSGQDFAANTGIAVASGSKIVVQIHYNTSYSPPTSDQTEIDLKVDPTVQTPAYALPWTDPSWVRNHTMSIPAGQADVSYRFSFDAMTGLSSASRGAVQSSSPITVWSAALHQHLLGTHSTINVTHADGSTECYLDIRRWDFHWQGSYSFARPKTIGPGDTLDITCHWDNSAANQPLVGGVRQAPRDVNWGEGTEDEMCIGFLYVTQ